MELTLADLTLSFLFVVCAASLAHQEAGEKEKNRKSLGPAGTAPAHFLLGQS